jgi:hypothetical protein
MSSHDWIGLVIITAVILGALFGINQLTKPYDISSEEFERRAKEEPGLINAGMIGLQKILEPATDKAVQAQEDLRQGRYNEEEGAGEPPEAGCGNKKE